MDHYRHPPCNLFVVQPVFLDWDCVGCSAQRAYAELLVLSAALQKVHFSPGEVEAGGSG